MDPLQIINRTITRISDDFSSCEGHQCCCQSDQAETVERQQMAGAGEFCDLWGELRWVLLNWGMYLEASDKESPHRNDAHH